MNKQIEIGYAYLSSHRLMSGVILYLFIAPILKVFTGIDICMPCLWNVLFGLNCPGCGLTGAFMDLIQFDFIGAWEHNALIFVLLPLGSHYFWTDLDKFKGKYLLEH